MHTMQYLSITGGNNYWEANIIEVAHGEQPTKMHGVKVCLQ